MECSAPTPVRHLISMWSARSTCRLSTSRHVLAVRAKKRSATTVSPDGSSEVRVLPQEERQPQATARSASVSEEKKNRYRRPPSSRLRTEADSARTSRRATATASAGATVSVMARSRIREVTEEDVQRQVKETLARLTNKDKGLKKSAKWRKEKKEINAEREREATRTGGRRKPRAEADRVRYRQRSCLAHGCA